VTPIFHPVTADLLDATKKRFVAIVDADRLRSLQTILNDVCDFIARAVIVTLR